LSGIAVTAAGAAIDSAAVQLNYQQQPLQLLATTSASCVPMGGATIGAGGGVMHPYLFQILVFY